MTEDLVVPEGVEPEQEAGPVSGVSPNDVPCKITLRSGRTFIVPKVQAWAYVEQGIFATGHWQGYSGEQDVLIYDQSVDYVELDFTALKKYLEKQASLANLGT